MRCGIEIAATASLASIQIDNAGVSTLPMPKPAIEAMPPATNAATPRIHSDGSSIGQPAMVPSGIHAYESVDRDSGCVGGRGVRVEHAPGFAGSRTGAG